MIPIYHLHASIIKRTNAKGQQRSVVAKAAYRAGERMFDESYGRYWNFESRRGVTAVARAAYRAGEELKDEAGGSWDFSRKAGVAHSEVSLPEWASPWMGFREKLWNAVEASEKRHDAQLAREVRVGLPNFFSLEQDIDLVREFVEREFTSRGMIADWSIHTDNPHNVHAHILLTMREVASEDSVLPEDETHEIKHAFKYGFLEKNRDWNTRDTLIGWREQWANVTNEHLAQAGYALKIDHRSYKDQGIDLIPQTSIGVGRDRRSDPNLPADVVQRMRRHERIAAENGERIIEDPGIALKAITQGQATFTTRDIAKFLHGHTLGAEQFNRAYLRVTTSPELVQLTVENEKQKSRYTTREVLAAEQELTDVAEDLAANSSHDVSGTVLHKVLSHSDLTPEQEEALDHLVSGLDLVLVEGIAGSGKSRLLGNAREIWEKSGYTVKGYALSSIAVQNLKSSRMPVDTLASLERQWSQGRNLPGPKDIIVIDENSMVGERMELRILQMAQERGAKVALIAGGGQLDAIESGAAHRHIADLVGQFSLTKAYRQEVPWQKEATELFYKGDTKGALELYEDHGRLVQTDTKERAKSALLAQWASDREKHPDPQQLILAYTNEEVFSLNCDVHDLLKQRGELGDSQTIETANGKREFSVGDRMIFLRSDKRLGVANGTFGEIEAIHENGLTVNIDMPDGVDKLISVDTDTYKDLDLGWAATVHKTQGSTLDRVYVLGSDYFDASAVYVAMSRHRQDAHLFYAAEDFGIENTNPEHADRDAKAARDRMLETLSRRRMKDRAHDYIQEETHEPAPPKRRLTLAEQFRADIEALNKQLDASGREWPDNPTEPVHEISAADLFKESLEGGEPEMLPEFTQDQLRRQKLEKEWEDEARRQIERERQRDNDYEYDDDYGL